MTRKTGMQFILKFYYGGVVHIARKPKKCDLAPTGMVPATLRLRDNALTTELWWQLTSSVSKLSIQLLLQFIRIIQK
jgi:hypothetical protein